MRLRLEIPIVRREETRTEAEASRRWKKRERGEEGGSGSVGTISAMPVRMRSGSFYSVQRFLRDSFVRYHRVQRAVEERRSEVGRQEEGTADGKRPRGSEHRARGKGQGLRRKESRTSLVRGTGLPRYSPGQEL